MPYAIETSWPPIREQISYGVRGDKPATFAWPPGGTLQWSYDSASAAEPTAGTSDGSASYEAHEAYGGLDAAAASKVVKIASATPTVPTKANETFAALRTTWIMMHGWEEGANILVQ